MNIDLELGELGSCKVILFLPTIFLPISPIIMAPTKASKPASAKKEKIFHPSSRKAGQLARKSLRKGKLVGLVNDRHKKQCSLGTCSKTLYNYIYR